MRKMLMLAAAMSLLAGPAAMAQHRHSDGGGGHHSGAARHAGGGGRHANRGGRVARSHGQRRTVHANRAGRAARAYNRGAYNRGAHYRGTHNRGAYNRRTYGHARHFNRAVAHRGGGHHWRHISRAGRWYRGGRLPYGYWRGRPWVNWRAHYLWAPPYGYQWVYVDGYYVLIAIGSGLIADIVLGY